MQKQPPAAFVSICSIDLVWFPFILKMHAQPKGKICFPPRCWSLAHTNGLLVNNEEGKLSAIKRIQIAVHVVFSL